MSDQNKFLLYTTPDGAVKVDVTLKDETLWMTQKALAELFGVQVPGINKHLKNIFESGELSREATISKMEIVRAEGEREVTREVEYYNLDAIIAVGYRVNSFQATQFRIWATQTLREFIIKGFAMDDERLKQSGGGRYFDELLERIRDIRSSEKVFWRKVLDIYATSIDYDPRAEASQQFFATVQNKMHWAAHGHTAAEIIVARADATKPNMGLTNFPGTRPRKPDAGVAKNYLNPQELEDLNLIVSLYLDFAELQARSRKPMTMNAWITKLDDFMRISEREILTHAGRVRSDTAQAKADTEFEKFRILEANKPSPVEEHFMEAIEQVKRLEKGKTTTQSRLKEQKL